MTGAEVKAQVMEALAYWRLDPAHRAALADCIVLTREEAEQIRTHLARARRHLNALLTLEKP